MIRPVRLALPLVAALALAGCAGMNPQTRDVVGGSAGGAALGGIIGSFTGDAGMGALLGAGAGAAGGYIYNQSQERSRGYDRPPPYRGRGRY
ncbi:MAG TPA: glycine zipper domain-containing protein [Roseomonas sp.]|nr:glycine zipper domain-containing protein [Roseomonas sp.]